MVQMGDEGHNRNRAGTLMLLRELLPDLVETAPAEALGAIVRFVAGNDHFFLNLVMPAGKLQTSAAAGIDGSSVVTTMARNGTDFGIQVSGLGERWFTGPAQVPEGLVPRNIRTRRRQPRHRRLSHRRDDGPRRLRHGLGTGDRAVRRRERSRRASAPRG